MTKRTKEWLIQRLDELLSEAKEIEATIRTWTTPPRPGFVAGDTIPGEKHEELDFSAFITWCTKCIGTFNFFLPDSGPCAHVHQEFTKGSQASSVYRFRRRVPLLRGVRDNLENGVYDDVFQRIEMEITCDYMGQAAALLNEGQSGKLDHVPAAVLAGAVLEKTLRTLCGQQSPPVETRKADGSNKMLMSLIDDLKKAGLYNEAQAKQLRAWAAIRNHAAHGEFKEFNRQNVELMLTGINNFLAEYFG